MKAEGLSCHIRKWKSQGDNVVLYTPAVRSVIVDQSNQLKQ